MLGVELVDPSGEPDACGARPPASDARRAVRRECLQRGLIVELGGRHDAVVRLLPPLIITDEQAETVLDRLADALARRRARRVRDRLMPALDAEPDRHLLAAGRPAAGPTGCGELLDRRPCGAGGRTTIRSGPLPAGGGSGDRGRGAVRHEPGAADRRGR